jgi:uncharacterized protein (TIGR03435 family)
MRKLLAVTVLTISVGPALGQEAVPTFEVVSVKVNRSGSDNQSMQLLPGGRAVVTNSLLRPLIETAYALLPQQLVGGPSWLDSDRFDIVAQASENLPGSVPGGPPGRAQLMLQRLLAERFNLSVHTEIRELPIYELIVARADGRLGPRISKSKTDCMPLMAAYGRGEAPLPPRSECSMSGRPGNVSARGALIAMFASQLAGRTGRLVQDRTELAGGYDFDLEFVPDVGGASDVSVSVGDGVSLFTALEEQLGLKLRPVRAPVNVLVIDHLEHPTEN